jgi:magnesium transporter
MHPADIAYVLEALPTDERLIVWNLVNPELEGEVLLEVSDAVRESLIESMERTELVAAAETLDADELADLAPDLPQGVIDDVFRGCRSRSASSCAPRCPTPRSRSARSWTSTWSPSARM